MTIFDQEWAQKNHLAILTIEATNLVLQSLLCWPAPPPAKAHCFIDWPLIQGGKHCKF